MKNLVYLRDLFISNFGIKIYGIVYKKNIYYINGIYKYIFYMFPFSLLNYINIINFIYKKDTFYYITNVKLNMIIPIILNFTFYNNNDKNVNMTSSIKYYNSSIPFKFYIEYNKLDEYYSLNVKYMSKGKIIDKDIFIYDYYNKLLYELFI